MRSDTRRNLGAVIYTTSYETKARMKKEAGATLIVKELSVGVIFYDRGTGHLLLIVMTLSVSEGLFN